MDLTHILDGWRSLLQAQMAAGNNNYVSPVAAAAYSATRPSAPPAPLPPAPSGPLNSFDQQAFDALTKINHGERVTFSVFSDEPSNPEALQAADEFNKNIALPSWQRYDEQYAKQVQHVEERNRNTEAYNYSLGSNVPSSYGDAIRREGQGWDSSGRYVSAWPTSPPPPYEPKGIKPVFVEPKYQQGTVSAGKSKKGTGGSNRQPNYGKPTYWYFDVNTNEVVSTQDVSKGMELWFGPQSNARLKGAERNQISALYFDRQQGVNIWINDDSPNNARYPEGRNAIKIKDENGNEIVEPKVVKANMPTTTLKEIYKGKKMAPIDKFLLYVANEMQRMRLAGDRGDFPLAYEGLKNIAQAYYPTADTERTKTSFYKFLELAKEKDKYGNYTTAASIKALQDAGIEFEEITDKTTGAKRLVMADTAKTRAALASHAAKAFTNMAENFLKENPTLFQKSDADLRDFNNPNKTVEYSQQKTVLIETLAATAIENMLIIYK
jgi:hypothetical protein